MAYIVFTAMFLSMWMLSKEGIESAFLKVWIPFYLAMPFSFWVDIKGLPDPNFMQAAILPILFVLMRQLFELGKFEYGPMEGLMTLYVAIRVYCDFLGRGYSDAQNYAFYMISALLGPYVLARYVISNRRMEIATAQKLVLMFLFFFPLFLYEAKFWVSPIFKIFSGFFPNSFSGLSIRWGLARTAGTFEHPILACIMILAVYRLHRWLSWIGVWDQPQTGWLKKIQDYLKPFPFAFKHQITIILVLMALMTISRGPWIGGFAGAALTMVGNARNRKQMLIRVATILLIGGIAAKMSLDAYITPKVGEVLSGEAETMLYRKVMIEKYQAFLFDKLWSGWGLTTVPKIQGMESIDNAFFLMALQHGILAPIVFLTIMAYAIVSQIKLALAAPLKEPPIGFTFVGIYVMCLISFFTVYMGAQTEPLIFFLLGWGESIKRRVEEAPPQQDNGLPVPDITRNGFRRLML